MHVRLDDYRQFIAERLRERLGAAAFNDTHARIIEESITAAGPAGVTSVTVLRDRVTILHIDVKRILTGLLAGVVAGGATTSVTLAAAAIAALLELHNSTKKLDPSYGVIVLCMWTRGVTTAREVLNCTQDRGFDWDLSFVNERLQDLELLGIVKPSQDGYNLAERVTVEYREAPTLAEWTRRRAD